MLSIWAADSIIGIQASWITRIISTTSRPYLPRRRSIATQFYTIGDFPANARDLRPESLYASPWQGGWWRIRDAIDYMLTASISVLDVAAKYRTDLYSTATRPPVMLLNNTVLVPRTDILFLKTSQIQWLPWRCCGGSRLTGLKFSVLRGLLR